MLGEATARYWERPRRETVQASRPTMVEGKGAGFVGLDVYHVLRGPSFGYRGAVLGTATARNLSGFAPYNEDQDGGSFVGRVCS